MLSKGGAGPGLLCIFLKDFSLCNGEKDPLLKLEKNLGMSSLCFEGFLCSLNLHVAVLRKDGHTLLLGIKLYRSSRYRSGHCIVLVKTVHNINIYLDEERMSVVD